MKFFVGIGGIGASGLARLMRAQGHEVAGSDSTEDTLTRELRDEGIDVVIGHDAGNLPEGTELVIYSEAVPEDNPELVAAREMGIRTATYFETLGAVAGEFRLVAVAGTHGKTTTTAMLALILTEAGKDPSVLVGTRMKEFENSNFRGGEGEILLVEACEYKRNFRFLKPDLLGVLNVELDHVDYFKDFDDYEAAFEELAGQSAEVIWPDDVAEYEGEVGVPGWHNLMNAGMAAHMARRLGVGEDVIARVLADFQGTWRRFEYKGELNGAAVYDDYAHHPTEIVATLDAAREKHPDARIVAVFQPHQFNRTAGFMDEFAESFEEADEVIVPNIYEVRDQDSDKKAGSAEKLVAAISEHHDKVRHGDGFENTAKYLLDTVEKGDLVMVMGAGDITHMVPMLIGAGIVGAS
jgi:UDP-N-acetylmuramate--alanine ligase